MGTPFQIILPTTTPVPILVSIPHCGIAIPEDLLNKYDQERIKFITDTDFYVDQLYQFATDLGITIIKAHYSRWVIDLNRNPQNQNLYNDGRIITSLTPTTDFNGRPIYKSKEDQPTESEIKSRLEKYYRPYHNKISQILANFKDQFGIALLWDAHSIKRYVPSVYAQPFPDLVLGSNDQLSASGKIISRVHNSLSSSSYTLNHNHPFKGGHITRSFGRPENNIHALQLEMSKDCYMDDNEERYENDRAENIKSLLRDTLISLINKLVQ